MIKIFVTSLDNFNIERFNDYLNSFPEFLQKDFTKYRYYEDRMRTMAGKLLLRKAIKAFKVDVSLDELKYNEYKKPYLDNGPYFSISHSNNQIICAASHEEVGADIEEIRDINIDDFTAGFSDIEISTIHNSNNQVFELFKVWTLKEALLKYSGKGFFEDKKITLRNNKLFFDEIPVCYQVVEYKNYVISLVSKNMQNIEIIHPEL